MVDYIADYMETIEQRRVLPEVQPGYLRDMLPNNAPTHAERWEDIMADVEHAIMPGVRKPIPLSCSLFVAQYSQWKVKTLKAVFAHNGDD